MRIDSEGYQNDEIDKVINRLSDFFQKKGNTTKKINKMEIYHWLDRNIEEVKDGLLFGKYFDTVDIECIGDAYFLVNPIYGIDLILSSEQIIKTVHLFGKGHNGILTFADKIFENLDFSLSRIDIRKRLGVPNKTGGGGESILYKNVANWDKYDFLSYSIHFQYNESEESISLITISSLINYNG